MDCALNEPSSRFWTWSLISGLFLIALDIICIAFILICLKYHKANETIDKEDKNDQNLNQVEENKTEKTKENEIDVNLDDSPTIEQLQIQTSFTCNECNQKITNELLTNFDCGHTYHNRCVIKCPFRCNILRKFQTQVNIGEF